VAANGGSLPLPLAELAVKLWQGCGMLDIRPRVWASSPMTPHDKKSSTVPILATLSIGVAFFRSDVFSMDEFNLRFHAYLLRGSPMSSRDVFYIGPIDFIKVGIVKNVFS
jgi:hypothetical protein